MWTRMSSTGSFYHFILSFFLFLLLPFSQWDVSACPSSCACGKDQALVMCQKGSWKDIEPKLGLNMKQLILEEVTGLETITASALKKQKFYHIKMLKINRCSLQTIEPTALAIFQNLENLNLGENNLADLDINSFSGLSNLKSLNLAKNKLSRLEDVLAPLNQLKTLDVSHNFLQDLSPQVFKNLSSLLNLNLNGNPLKQLSSQSFSGLNRLQELDLRDCSLDSIDFDVFYSIPKITSLDLGQNRLSKPLSKAMITDLSLLKILRFDRNQLQRLEHRDFAELDLETLDLSYNRITYIERTAFQNLTVQELDLSDNVILSLSTEFLNPLSSHLTSLNLAVNPIEKIEPNVFSDLQGMERLNLSKCQLNHIDYNTLKNMPALKILDISHNNLRFLSQATLDFINELKIANLHKNNWICDCQIKPLSDWLDKSASLTKLYCPATRGNQQDCTSLRCAAPSQLYLKLLHQLNKEIFKDCEDQKDSETLPASTQGAIVAACLGFAIIFLLITVYLWRRGKTGLRLKRVCLPSNAESSHMIDEDSKVPPLSNCDRASLNESDHEFVVRHYFDTLVTDPKLMGRTSDSEEPKSPRERDSLYSSQPSLYSDHHAAPMGIESTV